MSTAQKTITLGRSKTLHRFADIAASGEVVFHDRDLAVLWGITDTNLLHTTLSRYTRQNLLQRIWRGMYAIKPIEELDPILLGIKALHSYAYLGTETVLFRAGIINQRPNAITFISSASRRFSLAGNHFLSRKLDDRYLFQETGIVIRNGIRESSPERAVADLLYFNAKAHFDGPVDWHVVQNIQKELGYPPTSKRYPQKSTKTIVVKNTKKPATAIFRDLIAFIDQKVTDGLLAEDLNVLVPPETFRRIRKTLKQETLVFLHDELARLES